MFLRLPIEPDEAGQSQTLEPRGEVREGFVVGRAVWCRAAGRGRIKDVVHALDRHQQEVPSSRLVALGNVNGGPIPQMNSFEPEGERKKTRVDVAQSGRLIHAGSQRRLVHDGHDGPRDEVPVLRQLDRDHRLHVQDPDAPLLRPGVEVEVVLERHADEVRHRVLRLLREVRVAFGVAAGGRGRGRSMVPPLCYSLALLFRCASISFFTSSGVSFGRSMVSVSLSSVPVNGNGTW
jgi:hypothetical protein